MTENEAKELVRETLGAAFNRDAFARLLTEMLKTRIQPGQRRLSGFPDN